MTADNSLGVGVVGLHEGRTLLVALNHAIPPVVGLANENRRRVSGLRAVAGCDQDPEKLNRARIDCPDLFYTTDYRELLLRDDVNIVAIYTPDALHGEHIALAFEAGKHVICTKPLVNSMDDARRVWQASCANSGASKLLVGQSTRFFDSFRRQRTAYERGELGTIELVDAHYIHRMDWFYEKSPWAADTTDWVFLGLSHPLDLVRWYLGPIEQVQAIGFRTALANRYRVKSYDVYSVNLVACSGQIGRVMGHYGLHELPSARNAIELTLFGTLGTSLAQYHDMRYYQTTADGTEVKYDALYHQRAYYFNNEVHGMHYGEFANYAQYFADAVRSGLPYSPDLREGLETFCIMEAVRQSAATGHPVSVPPLLKEVGLHEAT
ncbi:MAG TPA: Gfo/Idh/MocA family oxidoreductase [Pirellulaceae bacterium]|nr:Gfo/Idh/MocA family oxidoreductase [Pirellulaceae bacterium]HMO90926.1 Gfo/Idh/MocA family oxidoreductase [Pirellulaceae bacterium]HMP68598.1 Gfo/Idh/MocA family oxidoreductase [Pirellulaceae bacterium]